jgi:ribose transport system permease protein
MASRAAPWTRIPGVAVMLAVLSAGFAIANPDFISPGNLTNVLVQSTVLLLISLPMTLIIITEGLDLSVGAVLTLASLIVAIAAIDTGALLPALLAGIAAALAFGLLNGWLVAWLRIPPFVATLGTLGIAQGLALVISNGQSVVGIPHAVQSVYSGALLGVPLPILIGAAAYLLTHALLYHTAFGSYIFALGGNREALVLAGLHPRRLLLAVYAFGGVMVGLGALLMTARLNGGHPTSGIGLEFDAIAAVAVGGTRFEHGDGWLFGTLLGVVTLGVLRNGLNLLAIPSSAQVACIGVLVILALLVDSLRGTQS